MGSDVITTGDGRDILFGDNGRVEYADGIVQTVYSTLPSAGGNDIITTGDGNKHVIGGYGDDNIFTGNGDDILIGDNGVIHYDANGLPRLVYSTWPEVGGDDILRSRGGTNIIIGGSGSDELYGGSGRNALFGDGGKVTLVNGKWFQLETIDHFIGGDDIIHGGTGINVMLGGAGNDVFVGNLSTDVMIDTYGRVTFVTETGKALFVVRLDTISLIANTMTWLEGGKNLGEIPEVEKIIGTGALKNLFFTGAFDWKAGDAGVNLVAGQGSHGLVGAVESTLSQSHHEASPDESERPEGSSEQEPEDQTVQEEAGEMSSGSQSHEAPGDGEEEDVADDDEAAEDAGHYDQADAGGAAFAASLMGWKVFAGSASTKRVAKNVIDRQSFKDLSSRQHKKRFKRWTSVGL